MLKRSLEQEKIFEEIKNGTGNILVNAKAGTGKCLGKNTLVVKSTGERVKVQDLVVGDKLMGDDGTHRTILSTTIGKGKLYKVTVPSTNEFFICNDEHILTCTLGRNTIPFDISINDVINNYEKSNKNIYETFTKIKLYRHIYNIEFNEADKTNYYNMGYTFFDKDYKNKSIITTLENRYDIISGLIDNYFIPIKSTFKINFKINKNIKLFNTLLRSCGYEYISGSKVIKGDFTKLKLRNKEYYNYLSINRGINNVDISLMYFNIEEYKKNGDYYGFTLDGNGRFLINDFIVTHNTTTIVNSLDAIEEGKSIMMLAFNKHIANELKERVPKRDKLFVSTTHSLGWGALRKKYKNATVDFDKAFKVIRKKLTRWNIREVDDVDQYINMIKNLVDLCRVTLTTKRSFIPMLAQNHGYQINDEDARRVLSVMEDMYNDTETFDFVDMIYLPAIDNKIWLFPNDYVFVDECVDGRSHILLKDDKIERIQDLYEKHIDKNGNIIDKDKLPYVLSYNVEKQKNEYRRISNIMYKGRKRVTYISIVNTYMFATPSHLFYTTEGWREVKDLKYGDAIISNEYNRFNNAHYPDDEQVDFLYSYLLCFGLYESSNNRYKFRFYIKNKDKRRFNFINKITPLYVKANVDRIKMTEYSTVMFYLNDKTYNKEYLIKNMTIKQLAISYIVSYKYFKDIDKYGFFISVNTFDEMVYAKELFEQRFGRIFDIKNYIKSSYLIPRDQDWFFDLIKEYIPKSFKDIISEKYWPETGKYTYKPNYSQQYCGTVGRIRPENKMADVYDITVEDNNNYFITSVDSTSFRKRSKDMIVGFLTHNCQDYNRAQQYMLNKIVKKDKGRLISVGDPHQCQPKGTKVLMSDGTEKNIEDIVVGDRVISYERKHKSTFLGIYCNEKYREKYAPKIEETSKRLFNSKLIVIESNNKTTKYTENHRCFVRFRKDKIKGYVLYLMEYNGYFRIGITPLWTKDLNGSLTMRAKSENAEKFWLLNIYETKSDAYFDEQYYSLIYGIPQMIFKYRMNGNSRQNVIDKFYSRFDKNKLYNSSLNLLKDFNRFYEYPIWVKNNKNYVSKVHMFQIHACNIIQDYMEVIHFNENNISYRTHGNNKKRDKIIKPDYKKIDKLYYEEYNDYVYSLKVSKYESYVADGILTHNSIYFFNGSSSDAFNWFREKENTIELPLTTSYRSAKSIIQLAQTLVPQIQFKHDAEDGEVREGSVLELAKPGDFVLARKNKPLVILLFDFLKRNQVATIRGNDIGNKIAETLKKYKSISELDKGLTTKLNDMRDNLINNLGVIDYRSDQRYISLDDNIGIIRFLMSNTGTIEKIIHKISLIFSDNPQGIILSTIHKSKGLEADTVFIIKPDEIRLKTPVAEVAQQEKNLEYIAYTRAKNTLIFDREWTDERD